MIPISVLTEDVLSRNVVRKLLESSGQKYEMNVVYDSGGFGYIKSKIKSFNKSARGTAFFVLTDLDTHECAPDLRNRWIAPDTIHPNMIFRVAVREVEAWLLADGESFAQFLGIRRSLVPTNPEQLADPKETLINLAAKSRKRNVKDAIVPDIGTRAKQGPDYNGMLSAFVGSHWDVLAAEQSAPSLEKAMRRLRNYEFTQS